MQLTGHTDWVMSVAISSDGKRVASGGRVGTIRLWDWENSRLIRAYRLPKRVGSIAGSVAFSPDGRRILSGGYWLDNILQIKVHPELLLWRVPDELGLWLLGTQEEEEE